MPTTKLQNISDSLLTRELYELSQTYLDLFLYENAVFYAEKLYCECQNEEVCYLLAKGYIGLGKFHQAYQILKETKGHQCRYLFVIICIKLNKFIDAEKGILTQKLFGKGINNKDLDEVVPQGAYGYYLYGNILEKLNRKNDAFIAYKKSMDIDPFMWCSFNKMCKIDPKKVDHNKYYSELNPKILLFNKKMSNILLNPENNNIDNKSMNKIKINIANNNMPISNNNIFTSVDNSTNSLNSRENPINSVANFRISTTSLNTSNNNNNISNDQMNKYRSILDFGQANNNINSKIISVQNTENKTSTPDNNNKTPSIHKKNGEVDYEKNYLPQKKVNNPFVFSSTPNQVQLDFNNLSSSAGIKLGSNVGGGNNNNVNSGNNNINNVSNNNNNQKEINNNNAKEASFSYFNINFSNNNNKNSSNNNINEGININNNISGNTGNNNEQINSNNRINPFNINNSGIFNNSNSLFNNGGNGGYNNININNMSNNLNNSFGLNFKLTPTHKMNSLFVQNNSNNGSSNNNNNNNNPQISKNNYLLNNIEISPDNKLNRAQQDNSNNINNALFNFSSETNKQINSTAFNKNNNINDSSDKDNKNNTINLSSNNNNNIINNNNNTLKFKNITQILNVFSDIIKKISNYDCAAALDLLLKKIPPNQFKSCFVYTLIGRCYFELAKYKDAEKYYNLSILLDPSYLTGLEYYSSVLWHLKDQYKCCNLAHHCLEQCQFSPETWVVLGNTFSLQKEHETAIKFFIRATQINPAFAYSYTLAGHEYVENENFSEANNCFKKALAFDERQVNAWWGLGNIQLKEQNYSEAVRLFKRCLSINNHSAILHFYLGTAYLQNKDIKNALNNLLNAQKLDPKNPMIQYQVANIYMSQGKNEEALKILKNLEENMPKEAPIYISIGKIYKNKKEYKKALDYFNKAIDLDPKDSNLAKTLIERLQMDNGSA
jgi:tetratricopeptide (TPR) repeat protein